MATRAQVTAAIERNWGSILEVASPTELVELFWGDWEGVAGSRPNVGARTLLAKTCTVCGGLHSSVDYYQDPATGYWATSCRGCHSGGGGWQWEYQNQAASLQVAEKRYQPYTGADLEVIARTDLTIAEKALLLNRTVWGIKTMVKKLRQGDNPTVRRLTESHPLTTRQETRA